MAINIWNLEWLNHNSQRSYPITDWSSKESIESSHVKIPDDFILALSISINGCHSLDIDRFYIKSILVMESGCSIIIGYDDRDVAVTHVLANSEQTTYSLTGVDDFSDIRGYIAVNPQSNIMRSLSGYYNFTREATQLEPDCIRPMIQSISSITAYSDSANKNTMYGDIVFRAGANMEIENYGNTLVFSAIDSCGMSSACSCDTEDTDLRVVTSINGVFPDETGNLNITTGSNCLAISQGVNSINLADSCSEPCCGCVELDALYENIKDFINGASTLQKAVEALAAKQDQLSLVYNSEGKNSCNCKVGGGVDKDTCTDKYVYCYHLCDTGNMVNIHTFEFASKGEDPKYAENDSIQVKGNLNDPDVWWQGTVTSVKVYRTFTYWSKSENEEEFKISYMNFGKEWIKHNKLEEYRAYFDAIQFNTDTDGPESIPDRATQL